MTVTAGMNSQKSLAEQPEDLFNSK